MSKFSAYILFILMLAAAMGPACGRRGNATLNHAEAIMEQHPDSALALLDTIKPSTLSSDAARAKYTLLLTQAKIKNHEFVSNDSMMAMAAEFYNNGSNKHYKSLANYLLGRVKYNMGDYSSSLMYLIEATESADIIDDSFLLGLIYRSIADSYNATYNYDNELANTKHSVSYFLRSGRQPHIDYALNDLARAYCNTEKYDSAIMVSKQVVDSAITHDDENLYIEALRIQAISYFSNLDYAKASNIYEVICSSNLATPNDSAYLGLSYVRNGQFEASRNVEPHSTEDLAALYLKKDLYKASGNYEKSLLSLEKIDSILDNVIRKDLAWDLSSAVVDRLSIKRELADAEAQIQQKLNGITVLVFILILIAIFIKFNSYRKQQQLKIDRNLELAEQFKSMLEVKVSEYSRSQTVIQDLMRSKYEWLNELCMQLYEDNNNRKRAKIANAIDTILDHFFNDEKKLNQLEEIVNKHYNNIIADFRKDLPNLKDSDYQLYILSLLGFSSNSIAVILKVPNVSSIYNKRRHLKDKIKSLEEIKYNRYLQFF